MNVVTNVTYLGLQCLFSSSLLLVVFSVVMACHTVMRRYCPVKQLIRPFSFVSPLIGRAFSVCFCFFFL